MEGASIGQVGGAMDYATFAEQAALRAIEVVVAFIGRAGELG